MWNKCNNSLTSLLLHKKPTWPDFARVHTQFPPLLRPGTVCLRIGRVKFLISPTYSYGGVCITMRTDRRTYKHTDRQTDGQISRVALFTVLERVNPEITKQITPTNKMDKLECSEPHFRYSSRVGKFHIFRNAHHQVFMNDNKFCVSATCTAPQY